MAQGWYPKNLEDALKSEANFDCYLMRLDGPEISYKKFILRLNEEEIEKISSWWDWNDYSGWWGYYKKEFRDNNKNENQLFYKGHIIERIK